MEKFIDTVRILKPYIVEITLVGLSIVVVIASIVVYAITVKAEIQKKDAFSSSLPQSTKEGPIEDDSSHIIVDMTGAVTKPDSYELPLNARLKDALKKAGGLSELADKDFFYRNYNLARVLSDQEKIYIPSVLEVSSGIFKESSRLVESTSQNGFSSESSASEGQSSKIHINSASVEELDSLPGIGATTAQKIIESRPYERPDQLVAKKIVGSATFSKIKDLIDL